MSIATTLKEVSFFIVGRRRACRYCHHHMMLLYLMVNVYLMAIHMIKVLYTNYQLSVCFSLIISLASVEVNIYTSNGNKFPSQLDQSDSYLLKRTYKIDIVREKRR
jgi:hypothetical protein